MCGRFLLADDTENHEIRKIIEEINMKYGPEEASKLKTGEIFPTNFAPTIIIENTNKINITLMKWGFPSHKGKGVIINARQETLDKKPTFKNILHSKRCLVPASGFFEWKKTENGRKDKYLIRTKLPAFYMAGLYNTFINENTSSYTAFVIITTGANKEMAAIHDRMPVIFHKEQAKLWLNQNNRNMQQLKELFTPYKDSLIFCPD